MNVGLRVCINVLRAIIMRTHSACGGIRELFRMGKVFNPIGKYSDPFFLKKNRNTLFT
jgi:hypothetical protein